MRHLHFVSGFKGSINEVTEDLIEGLKDSYIITREGFDELKEYDILISHFINPNISKSQIFDKFKHKILIQPIDGTSIKRDIIEEFNKYDIIITPGQAGKNILLKNGVYKPIEVIPNFYKQTDLVLNTIERPTPVYKKLEKYIKDKFIFYHESTCHPRKGVDIMLRAYVKTFSSNIVKPKVVLILKTPSHNPTTFDYLEKLKKEIDILQKQYKYPAKIIKISQWCTKEELTNLMYLCDCYVQPSKIEGFGIPVLRAAAMKKTIIATDSNLNGYMDFLTDSALAYLVPGKIEVAIGEINPMYTEVSEWCVIDENRLGEAMKGITCLLNHKNKTNYFNLYSMTAVIEQYKKLLSKPIFEEGYKFIESKVIIK